MEDTTAIRNTGNTFICDITILIPARHRLDHEKDYNKLKKWDPVDTLEAVGGPGLCE